jgi:mono/diheme cytochrome c family protein
MRIHVLPLIFILTACSPYATTPQAGRALFVENCATCHGADARGGAQIPDLTGLSLRAAGSFPRSMVLEKLDAYARGNAVYAGTQMPEFGFLLTGPLARVDESDGLSRPYPEAMIALSAWLESVQR